MLQERPRNVAIVPAHRVGRAPAPVKEPEAPPVQPPQTVEYAKFEQAKDELSSVILKYACVIDTTKEGHIRAQTRGNVRRRIIELCFHYKVQYGEIVGSVRTASIVAARHAMIADIAIEFPGMSLPELGRAFGGKDHTSILHAIRKEAARRGYAIRGHGP